MIVIGIDSHKRTHTAVAADVNGRKLGEVTLGTTSAGHLELVRWAAPSLLALPGCGPLSAAKLVGQVAKAGRFRSAAAFARHNGSAPLPVWSGDDERGRAYYQHRRAAGDTKTEAIRALKRRMSDEIFRRMRHDERLRATPRAALAAAA